MPTYEYTCSTCHTAHEIQQKMTDATLTVCPQCGEETLRKVFSGVGVHFKGSGFYRTDSRDSKKSNTGSSSSSSTSSSGSSSTSTPSTGSPSTGSSSGSSSSGSSSSGSSSSSTTPSTS